jgi:NTP pyrophosphatase (non-canonical NTP hydrolase)
MTKNVDLNRYAEFVDGITSTPSKDLRILIDRLQSLEAHGVQVSRLLTAGIGLPGEAGEFSEIVKKIVFHGKELDEENATKLKKELGDVAWYWTQACLALGIDPNSVISENVAKLEARYPGGVFDVYRAENRAENDD